jgi:hypothetical protein
MSHAKKMIWKDMRENKIFHKTEISANVPPLCDVSLYGNIDRTDCEYFRYMMKRNFEN